MKNNIATMLLARVLSIICISALFVLSIAERAAASPTVQPELAPTMTLWSTGTISTPVTWTAAGSPYLVTVDVTITATGSLTIEPGVIVKMNSGTDLTVDGALILQDTASSEVVFTSYRDDSYGGDTNNDGASVGVRGDWNGITIRSALTSSLSNLRIRYGFKGILLYADNAAETISPNLSNLIIEETSFYSVEAYAYGSGSVVSPALQNAHLLSSGSHGIYADAYGVGSTASPSLNGVELGNNFGGIFLSASGSSAATAGMQNVEIHHSNSAPINFSGNGWATDLGGLNLRDNATSGVRISGTLSQSRTLTVFDGLPYYLSNDLMVATGATLTLPAGVIIKASPGAGLIVDGTLVLQSTPADPIIFTSYRDDSYGGDMNGGGASVGTRGDWEGIVIRSPITELSNLRIRYASTGLCLNADGAAENISPNLSNLIIEENSSFGLYAHASGVNSTIAPDISDTQILATVNYGLNVNATGTGSSVTPTLNGVVLGNTTRGISVSTGVSSRSSLTMQNTEIHHADFPIFLVGNGWVTDLGGNSLHDNIISAVGVSGTLSQNRTWTPIAGLTSYYMDNTLTVDAGATLTLPAGIIVKADTNSHLNVYGALVSEGTADNPVVFTSYKDDSIGGDTNGNGASVGAKYDWGGISINSAATTTLNNMRIRYAGLALYLYANDTGENISPNLSNLLIEYSYGQGLHAYAYGPNSVVSPVISNSQILSSGSCGVYASALGSGASTSIALDGVELGSNETGLCLGASGNTTATAALHNVEIHHSEAPMSLGGNGWLTDQGGVNLHDNDISALLVGGTLDQDRTWTPFFGLPYQLHGDLRVSGGVTLTIPAGTVVKARGDLIIAGTLVSQGTAAEPVIFTSYRDDIFGGDTNNDGPSVGAPGDWSGISIESSAMTSLSNLRIRYASQGLNLYAAYVSQNISPSLTNLLIEDSSYYGLEIYAGGPGSVVSPSVDNVQILRSAKYGILVKAGEDATASPTFNSAELGNNDIGIYLETCNTSNSNATAMLQNVEIHHSRIPLYFWSNGWVTNLGGVDLHDNTFTIIGTGGSLSQNRTWEPFLGLSYYLDTKLTVMAGATLTLPVNTIVKANTEAQLVVDGVLDSRGEVDNPVIFTAFSDDSYGGDTNNNGASAGVRGVWTGLSITSSTMTGLSNLRIRYATIGLDLLAESSGETISPNLSNLVIEESSSYGLRAYASGPNSVVAPVLNNLQLLAATTYGLYAYASGTGASAAPVLDGVVLGNNGIGIYASGSGGSAVPTLENVEIHHASFPVYSYGNGWVIDQGGNDLHDNSISAVGIAGTLSQNRTWTPFSGLSLYLDNDVTVAAGVTLTLPAGLLIKADAGSQLIVDGTLVSQGSKVAPVVFTSYRDDSYGGDTNNNGATRGSMNDWDGILLRGAGTTTFVNAIIHYAREGLSIYAQGITLAPTIRNVDIQFSYNAIYLYAASGAVSPTISDSLLTGNMRGVYINTGTSGMANPQIQHCDIYGNHSYGILSGFTGGTVNAENNWWGYLSGPFHSSLNPTGSGNQASSNVDFDPWLQENIFLNGEIALYPSTGVAPLGVHFNWQGSGGEKPLGYTWEFGDGETSSDAMPVHTYTNEGTYPVKLTVVSADEQSLVRFASVEVYSPITATINATPTSGSLPLAVTFTATAAGGVPPYTYRWDFNQDGVDDSLEQNPSHTFYSSILVRLTVEDWLGYSAETIEEITVSQPFSVTIQADPPGGSSPLIVAFGARISGGTGPFTYAWDFDSDGSYDSTLEAPSHEFTRDGSYTVALRVSDSMGVDAFASLPVQVTLPPATLFFTQLDATKFPIIESRIRVVGADRKLLTGLSEANFRVTEQSEHESTAVDEVFDVVGQPQTSGISVALVMDISGSMDGYAMAQVKNAGNRFVDHMTYLDKAAIIPFGSDTWIQQPFTTDPFALHAAINALGASGATALYDGVYLGIDQCNTQTGVRAVVIFTDGGDNSSHHTVEGAIAHANETGIPVFTIGVGSEANTALLESLAHQTGGYYTFAPSAADLAQIYTDIAAMLQNQYLITYLTHNPAFDQTERTVSISVTYDEYTSSAARKYQVMGTPQISLAPETAGYMSASQPPDADLPISVNINGDYILAVTLYYRRTADGGRYQTISMAQTGPGVYSATLPADYVQMPGVDFYVEASNGMVTLSNPLVDAATHSHQITVMPNTAPTLLHTPVTYTALDTDLLTQAAATDNSGSLAEVTLHYRCPRRVVYTDAAMALTDNNVYQGVIPLEAMGEDGIEYYITATDKNGITTYNGTAQVPHQVNTHEGEGNSIFLPMVKK